MAQEPPAQQLAQQLDALAHAEARRVLRLEVERAEAVTRAEALEAENAQLRREVYHAHSLYCAVLAEWRHSLLALHISRGSHDDLAGRRRVEPIRECIAG
jgi:hypothetical protein|eukprot:COSAG01_NODE_7759_length_3065_cov_2.277871_5_plen_100_part_00